MMLFILAAILGSVSRYLADFYLPRHGILLINILGSFVAGSVLTLATIFQFNEILVQAILGGFAGALTTYSTVAVIAAQQHLDGTGSAWKTWILHAGLSITACLCGLVLPVLVIP